MTVANPTKFLNIDSSTLDLGYKNCRVSAKQLFSPFLWMVSNVGGAERRSIDTILAYLARVSNFLDMFSQDGLPMDMWESYQTEVNEALQGRCRTSELAALYQTVTQYDIDRRYIEDPLKGADLWMRTPQFETVDEFNQFTSMVGGSSLAALFPILDIHESPDHWKPIAEKGGQAIYQTILLANMSTDLKQDQIFLPKDLVQNCKVDFEQVKAGNYGQSFRHLCRTQVAMIEPHLKNLGERVFKFELDGQRVMKSLLSWTWNLLMKVKNNPESIHDIDGLISKREMFVLKAKHWLGLEGNVPIIPEASDDHH